MRRRAPLAVALAAIVALAPSLALPALAASDAPSAQSAATRRGRVRPEDRDRRRRHARGHRQLPQLRRTRSTPRRSSTRPNVVKVYSPNATWTKVKAAAQGASILIYLGHGSGYPRDDSAVFNPNGHDGMGLNSAANKSDYVAKYYGENYMANDIRLAKNAVVILSHLCFASGNSDVRRSRADLRRRGAADRQLRVRLPARRRAHGHRRCLEHRRHPLHPEHLHDGPDDRQHVGLPPSNHGHQMPFTPLRNPAYQAVMDPNNWTSGFYRSIVGAFGMRTTDVIAGASDGVTSKHPSTFQAPGAAAVGDAPVTLYEGAALGQPTGAALPAGEAVRVTDVVPAEDGVSEPALEVETLDGSTGGWVDGAGLIPRDSAGPELWSMDGPDTISPNFDGYLDRLNLWARFSESVDWSVKVKDGDGDVVRSLDGTGHQAGISWDALLGDDPAPDGDYTWHLKANDAWGNPTLDEDGEFSIANEAVPGTAVLSLEPEAATTRASSTTYTLTFAGPVTGLTKADFTRTGTARCDLGKPAGGPAVYTITLSDCSTGTATLTLASGSVTDEAAQLGPAGAIASKITIDRSDPSTSTPRPTLRKGLQIGGGANAPLPMTLSWTGSDTGSGVASYDVRQSVDGGPWDKIADATAATSLQTSVTPGHTYRFMVRARDKAGNVGSWSGGYAWNPRLVQESHGDLAYTGAWSSDANADASADGLRSASDAGASVKYTFHGRAVAWVTQLAPDSGEVAVYIDGDLVATIDTHADATTERFVAFTTSWSSYGKHSIKLVVVGTTDRPRVDVDAFEVVS